MKILVKKKPIFLHLCFNIHYELNVQNPGSWCSTLRFAFFWGEILVSAGGHLLSSAYPVMYYGY